MGLNFKSKTGLALSLIILLSAFSFITQAKAQGLIEEYQDAVIKEIRDGTRVVITTSGPAKFNSFWLDDPPRLVVEFQSRNILSKIGNEVVVNQGVIKRITSSYFEGVPTRPLKTLTFELSAKVPYKIWQEDNTILLDIQTPLETPIFRAGEKEVFAEGETSKVIIRRLEAMDAALMRTKEAEPPLETPEAKIGEKISEETGKVKEKAAAPEAEVLPPVEPTKERKGIVGIIFLLGGLALISSTGFFFWNRGRTNKNQKVKVLETELQEKGKLLEQEKIIRKAVEKASLGREEEYKQLRCSLKSLKDDFIKNGLLKRELPAKEKEKPSITEKAQERRKSPRLSLTRDYNRTLILRIESKEKPIKIRSFANNISPGGLCFETKKEFKQKQPLNLRLFFYGDQVPMLKTRAHIIWKKTVGQTNYYGICFDWLDEKDKTELNHYIESKTGRGA